MLKVGFAALVFVGALMISSASQAATVNYSGTQYDAAGTIAAGQTGSVSTSPLNLGSPQGTYFNFLSGYIAPNTEIIFSFVTPTAKSLYPATTELYGYGSYTFTSGVSTFSGTSGATAIGGTSTVANTHIGPADLVSATANISSANKGQTTITNNSSVAAYFVSFLQSTNCFCGTTVIYTAVSTVPLPGSLPMFLLALTAVLGYGYQNRASTSRL